MKKISKGVALCLLVATVFLLPISAVNFELTDSETFGNISRDRDRYAQQTNGKIRVTSPNGGEVWHQGEQYKITWTSEGNVGNYVRIVLYARFRVDEVTDSTLNSGSYVLTVPVDQPSGSDYKVRITSTSNFSISDDSDDFFTISGKLTVTSPNGGEKWRQGTVHEITWTSEGDVGDYVKIELYETGRFDSMITQSTSNDGSYSWLIPVNQPPDEWYQVKIRSITYNRTSDQSDWYFSITSPPNNPPDTPSNPSPQNGLTHVNTTANLSWNGGDPDINDTVMYEVYFGESSDPQYQTTIGPYPATQIRLAYDPGTMEPWKTYYWKVVAKDNHNVTNDGPTWYFTTGGENIEIRSISGGIGVTAIVTNIGTEDATDVSWSIDVSGLVFLGGRTEGTIDVPAGGEATVSSGLVFGIGPGTIAVTAGGASKTASCFLFGPLVLGVT